MVTKDELLKQLDDLGVEGDPKATNAELETQLKQAKAAAEKRHAELADPDGFGAYPGDAVMYVLTEEDAEQVTRREGRFARFVKAVAPFEPRTYNAGDTMYGRVFSSFDDGTADIDLLESFPRVTLERVPLGDGPGHYQRRD